MRITNSKLWSETDLRELKKEYHTLEVMNTLMYRAYELLIMYKYSILMIRVGNLS